MESDRFDTLTRAVAATMHRRGLGTLVAGGVLSGLLARVDLETAAGKNKKAKNKKPKKKKGDCPRGQRKDAYGVCGFPPTDCLTVGALCSGTAQPCCSENCTLIDTGDYYDQYRCLPGKARCLVDYGCVPGYVCRGWRCVPG